MRFIPEAEAGALRAHLDKELEGPVTLDLFIEPKSAIVVPGRRPAPAWGLALGPDSGQALARARQR